MIFLSDFVLRNSLIIMSNVVFVKSIESCFIDRRNLKFYIFLYPNMSGGLDPNEKGWWRRWLCILTCALWVSIQIQCQIVNFLRVILRKGAIHTCTTAAQSMEGTASFFSNLDLNREVSSVSFKFKSARCPTRNRRNVPIKVFDGFKFARCRWMKQIHWL